MKVEEKAGEPMDEGEVKESGCRGYSNGRSSLCHTVEASEVPGASVLEDMEVHETPQPQAGLQTPTSQDRRQPIGPLNPLLCPALLELPSNCRGAANGRPEQCTGRRKWTPDRLPVDGRQYLWVHNRRFSAIAKGMIGPFI